MRILYDARSVRTPAGAYVFRGLSAGWLADHRVSSVIGAVPSGFDRSLLPQGVEPVRSPEGGWLQHIGESLPRLADNVRADIIFVPNGLPPADPRAVIYFQDLYHFHPLAGPTLRGRAVEIVRAIWRSRNAPSCRLAVPVSTDIHREVVRRLNIPIVMIPNGVDVGAARWSGGGDAVVVMGGHGARKGEDDALRAWAMLPPRVRRAYRLRIIGVQPEARRDELCRAARRLLGDEPIDIAGVMSRDDYLESLATATLAVSCSRLEAFGLPVAESLVMGAPVLASDLPAHRELMARAGAGETFAAGDVRALAAAMGRALNGAPPRRLTSPPFGWSWRDRARQHIDAYQSPA